MLGRGFLMILFILVFPDLCSFLQYLIPTTDSVLGTAVSVSLTVAITLIGKIVFFLVLTVESIASALSERIIDSFVTLATLPLRVLPSLFILPNRHSVRLSSLELIT